MYNIYRHLQNKKKKETILYHTLKISTNPYKSVGIKDYKIISSFSSYKSVISGPI